MGASFISILMISVSGSGFCICSIAKMLCFICYVWMFRIKRRLGNCTFITRIPNPSNEFHVAILFKRWVWLGIIHGPNCFSKITRCAAFDNLYSTPRMYDNFWSIKMISFTF